MSSVNLFPLTLPPAQPPRNIYFCIRVSQTERAAISVVAERLMRTIKEEEVDLSEYRDFHHAYQRIGQFLDKGYTRKRIHSALGYLTPSEFEAQWSSQPCLQLS